MRRQAWSGWSVHRTRCSTPPPPPAAHSGTRRRRAARPGPWSDWRASVVPGRGRPRTGLVRRGRGRGRPCPGLAPARVGQPLQRRVKAERARGSPPLSHRGRCSTPGRHHRRAARTPAGDHEVLDVRRGNRDIAVLHAVEDLAPLGRGEVVEEWRLAVRADDRLGGVLKYRLDFGHGDISCLVGVAGRMVVSRQWSDFSDANGVVRHSQSTCTFSTELCTTVMVVLRRLGLRQVTYCERLTSRGSRTRPNGIGHRSSGCALGPGARPGR